MSVSSAQTESCHHWKHPIEIEEAIRDTQFRDQSLSLDTPQVSMISHLKGKNIEITDQRIRALAGYLFVHGGSSCDEIYANIIKGVSAVGIISRGKKFPALEALMITNALKDKASSSHKEIEAKRCFFSSKKVIASAIQSAGDSFNNQQISAIAEHLFDMRLHPFSKMPINFHKALKKAGVLDKSEDSALQEAKKILDRQTRLNVQEIANEKAKLDQDARKRALTAIIPYSTALKALSDTSIRLSEMSCTLGSVEEIIEKLKKVAPKDANNPLTDQEAQEIAQYLHVRADKPFPDLEEIILNAFIKAKILDFGHSLKLAKISYEETVKTLSNSSISLQIRRGRD